MTIDEQAREYAAKTLAEDKEAVAHDWEMGFKAGARRAVSQQELEAAVFVIQSFPNAESLAIARAIARALGHVLEEPVGTPEREET